MAVKITHQSSNPAYILFHQWIEEKLNHAQETGDTAEYQKISAAIAAKAAANAGQDNGSNETVVENGVVKSIYTRPNFSITVPEFDFYWNQWKNEFNVEIIIEEV